MYSCIDGKTSDIRYGDAVAFNLEFKLPVVNELKANKIALLPINPSLINISISLKSSAKIESGHPP